MYKPKCMTNYQINPAGVNRTEWRLGINMNQQALTLKHPSILPQTSSLMAMQSFMGDRGTTVYTGGILLFLSSTFTLNPWLVSGETADSTFQAPQGIGFVGPKKTLLCWYFWQAMSCVMLKSRSLEFLTLKPIGGLVTWRGITPDVVLAKPQK